MRTQQVVVVAGLSFGAGGALLLVGAAAGLGPVATAGVAALLLGMGGLVAALIRMAQVQERRERRLEERVRGLERELKADLDRRAAEQQALRDHLTAQVAGLDADRAEERARLRAILDARILGLHELVREVTTAPATAPRSDRDGGDGVRG